MNGAPRDEFLRPMVDSTGIRHGYVPYPAVDYSSCKKKLFEGACGLPSAGQQPGDSALGTTMRWQKNQFCGMA